MGIVERAKDAWSVLRGRKSLSEVGETLASWFHGRSATVTGWQFKAAKLLAEEVGAAAFRLYKVKADGTWSEVDSNPILDLLHRPNPNATHAELFEAVSMSLDFYGNAFLFLEGADSPTSKPKALYPLKPQHVSIVRTDGFPDTILSYKYRHKAREYIFQPHQILHIRESNPDDPLVGLGAVQAMADAVDLDHAARVWNRAFFRNSARPDLILKSKFKTREQMDPIRAQFEDKYQGAENAHKIAILPDGVEPEKMGWSQKDMDFVEQLRWSRDDILSGLRTPHVVLGLGAGENLNRATAEATNYIYALRTVMPRLRRIAAFFNTYLVIRFGKDLVIDFDNVVPEDEDLQVRKRVAALGGAPYESLNEVRDELGLPAVDGGDSVMAPYSQTPIGSPKEAKAQRKLSQTAYPALKAAKEDSAVSSVIHNAVDAAVSKAADKIETVKKSTGEDHKEAAWRNFVSRVSPYEILLKKRMAEYAAGMIQRVEENLESASKDVDLAKLLNRKDDVRLLIQVSTPTLSELYRSEGEAIASDIGSAFDATVARIREAVDGMAALLAQNYHDETVRLLREALNASTEAGEGFGKLKTRIRDIGDFSSNVRASRVARTEAFRVANDAGREAYRQAGVKKLVWYTSKDERVCEFCGPEDGRVVGIEENYYEKGDVIQGRDGGVLNVDYSNIGGGALHPNCRCRVVQYIEGLE
ncbi:MAG: phage portal protein [Patescibacteria group bacterium]